MRKGFGAVGVIIVIAVVAVIGGGMYYYQSEKENEIQTITTQDNTPPPIEEPLVSPQGQGTEDVLITETPVVEEKEMEEDLSVTKETEQPPQPSPVPVVIPPPIVQPKATAPNVTTILAENFVGEFFMPRKEGDDIWPINSENVMRRFYEIRQDVYDFLVVFPTKKVSSRSATSFGVNQEIDGIGNAPKINNSDTTNKLRSFTTNGLYQRFESFGGQLDIFTNTMMHEMGHHWCCIPVGWPGTNPENHHYFNSTDLFNGDSRYVDLMGLFHWIRTDDEDLCVDSNDHQNVTKKFSKLTLYLMGLLPKEQVGPFYYHVYREVPGNDVYNKNGPSCGAGVVSPNPEFLETRVYTIDDIINSVGPRTPSSEQSQKDFTVAFIIVADQEIDVTQDFINLVNSHAEAIPDDWKFATDNLSTLTVIK